MHTVAITCTCSHSRESANNCMRHTCTLILLVKTQNFLHNLQNLKLINYFLGRGGRVGESTTHIQVTCTDMTVKNKNRCMYMYSPSWSGSTMMYSCKNLPFLLLLRHMHVPWLSRFACAFPSHPCFWSTGKSKVQKCKKQLLLHLFV